MMEVFKTALIARRGPRLLDLHTHQASVFQADPQSSAKSIRSALWLACKHDWQLTSVSRSEGRAVGTRARPLGLMPPTLRVSIFFTWLIYMWLSLVYQNCERPESSGQRQEMTTVPSPVKNIKRI